MNPAMARALTFIRALGDQAILIDRRGPV